MPDSPATLARKQADHIHSLLLQGNTLDQVVAEGRKIPQNRGWTLRRVLEVVAERHLLIDDHNRLAQHAAPRPSPSVSRPTPPPLPRPRAATTPVAANTDVDLLATAATHPNPRIARLAGHITGDLTALRRLIVLDAEQTAVQATLDAAHTRRQDVPA